MKKYNLSKEDTDFWEEQTKNFQKIPYKQKTDEPYINKIMGYISNKFVSNFNDEGSSNSLPNLAINDFSGINRVYLKKIRNGSLQIDNSIDLHSLTLDNAFDVFIKFIIQCAHNRDRIILVVSGKGRELKDFNPDIEEKYTGKIKSEVKNGVNNYKVRKYILAFCLSHKKDGGEGAYYIFLKNIYK